MILLFLVVLLIIVIFNKTSGRQNLSEYLRETKHLDFQDHVFWKILGLITADSMSLDQKLEKLFYFTRDGLQFANSAHMKASDALREGKALCYTKAMIYISFCRRLGIPAKLAMIYFHIIEDAQKGRRYAHGIAKIYLNGRWIYVDTVSNRDAWNHWGIKETAAFEPPRFTGRGDVVVSSEYYDCINFKDYETNDVPQEWLDQMCTFLKTGKWRE